MMPLPPWGNSGLAPVRDGPRRSWKTVPTTTVSRLFFSADVSLYRPEKKRPVLFLTSSAVEMTLTLSHWPLLPTVNLAADGSSATRKRKHWGRTLRDWEQGGSGETPQLSMASLRADDCAQNIKVGHLCADLSEVNVKVLYGSRAVVTRERGN